MKAPTLYRLASSSRKYQLSRSEMNCRRECFRLLFAFVCAHFANPGSGFFWIATLIVFPQQLKLLLRPLAASSPPGPPDSRSSGCLPRTLPVGPCPGPPALLEAPWLRPPGLLRLRVEGPRAV